MARQLRALESLELGLEHEEDRRARHVAVAAKDVERSTERARIEAERGSDRLDDLLASGVDRVGADVLALHPRAIEERLEECGHLTAKRFRHLSVERHHEAVIAD